MKVSQIVLGIFRADALAEALLPKLREVEPSNLVEMKAGLVPFNAKKKQWKEEVEDDEPANLYPPMDAVTPREEQDLAYREKYGVGGTHT